MKARFNLNDYTGLKPKYSACLLYGNDPDLIDERSVALIRSVAGSLDDPFRVVTLSPEEHGKLAIEVPARSLAGGRRVVRVRDCGERVLPLLAGLDVFGISATLVLLAGVLTSKSKLRRWAQQTDWVGSVACEADDPMRRQAFVKSALAQAGLTAGQDTQDLLIERLPAGRRALLGELEKLSLLSKSGDVRWDDAREILDEKSMSTMFTTVDLAFGGHGPAAVAAWEQAFEAGSTGVSLVRIAGMELGRLAALRTEREQGVPLHSALERQRLYPWDSRFRHWSGFVEGWTSVEVFAAMRAVLETEIACKTTGSDDRLLVARLLMLVANHNGAAV